MGSKGMKIVKVVVGSILGIVVVALIALRIIAPEPANVPGSTVVAHGLNYFVRPGFWQKGEVVRTPVEDWSFVKKFPTVVMETRSPYFIPHSVRVGARPRKSDPSNPDAKEDLLYIPSAQYRMEKGFPDRLWTSNVYRDPRVRMKVGDKIYEMTLVLVTDRTEAEGVWGRNPEYWSNEGGQERMVGYQHIYRAYQRNIPEFGSPTKPRDFSGLPGARRPSTPRPEGSAPAGAPPAPLIAP